MRWQPTRGWRQVCKSIFQEGISFGDLMITFGMAGALGLCMFVQLKFLNQGLRFFDVLFVLPVYQAFWIAGATMNGILFFEEYNNFSGPFPPQKKREKYSESHKYGSNESHKYGMRSRAHT
jgi:hypothetical protein